MSDCTIKPAPQQLIPTGPDVKIVDRRAEVQNVQEAPLVTISGGPVVLIPQAGGIKPDDSASRAITVDPTRHPRIHSDPSPSVRITDPAKVISVGGSSAQVSPDRFAKPEEPPEPEKGDEVPEVLPGEESTSIPVGEDDVLLSGPVEEPK